MTAEPVIRPARDADPVAEVVRAAFGDEGDNVAGLWAEIAESDLLLGSLVAELDGEVVGHVGLSHAWVDARRELVDVWVLSPLSVVPTRQGAGIGTRLVAAALDAARAGGAPLLFLEGDPGYYGRLGFIAGADLGFRRPSLRIPETSFQALRLPAYEPWMTGTFVYPDVFWRHDAVGLR